MSSDLVAEFGTEMPSDAQTPPPPSLIYSAKNQVGRKQMKLIFSDMAIHTPSAATYIHKTPFRLMIVYH